MQIAEFTNRFIGLEDAFRSVFIHCPMPDHKRRLRQKTQFLLPDGKPVNGEFTPSRQMPVTVFTGGVAVICADRCCLKIARREVLRNNPDNRR